MPITPPAELFCVQGINNVEIDFDDGAGFRILSKGSTVNIYYNTEGLKYLTARLTTSNGTRIAKCMIDYKRPTQYMQPDYRWNVQADPVYTDDKQYLGGNNLRSRRDLQVHQPVEVVVADVQSMPLPILINHL
jgi:hypothetical protein